MRAKSKASLISLKLTLAFASLVSFASFAPSAAFTQTLQRSIDPVASHARFRVAHVFVEHVDGTVPIVSGEVVLAPQTSIPTSVDAVLDATKISTDEPDRNTALESPDFFDSRKFPTWTFASSKITPSGANAFEMDGTLTIHGVTQPQRLTVTLGGDAAHPIYHAVGQVDRHAFGMAITRLDPVIGGMVDITLDIALLPGA